MAKGEVICPNGPKAVRVRKESPPKKEPTKRVARANGWRYKVLTKHQAAIMGANMCTWFIENPEADNLWDYLLNREPYSPSQIYEMQEHVPELKAALNFIYGLIAARAQKGWKEVNASKYYEKMFNTFSPELKELMREQAKLGANTGASQTIHITSDSMGMLADKKEKE